MFDKRIELLETELQLKRDASDGGYGSNHPAVVQAEKVAQR